MVKVVQGLPAEWGTCTRTVLLDDFTYTLSFQNNTIAVGSECGDIMILDAITGSQTAILSGHTEEVNCLRFSADGTSLISGSDDYTVKLWDVQTGGVVRTFSGHNEVVLSISISADHTTIASGSQDKTIYLWDIQTGKCHCIIKQQNIVEYVSFSPTDPQHLISISGSKVWQWDTSGHQIKPTCDGSYIAFSSDGTQLVLCNGSDVIVQNSDSGVALAKFYVTGSATKYCCFSPNSRHVVVASGSIIYVWDITSSDPHLVETFVGHTKNITSLSFSSPSSLISASEDKSVKFWKIGALLVNPVTTDLEPTPIALPLISSISLQARDGISISSDVHGVVKTWDISATLFKTPPKNPVEAYKHGNIKLINIWYADEKINIWDVKKGEPLLQAAVPRHRLVDIRISGDGSRVFYISEKHIQIWDIFSGEAVGIAEVGYSGVELLAMDGSRVWIQYPLPPTPGMRGWDLRISSSPVELFTMPPDRLYYLNSTKLWDSKLCRIQDTITKKIVFQLPVQFRNPVDVQWNGQYLAICSKSKKEIILEFHPTFLQ